MQNSPAGFAAIVINNVALTARKHARQKEMPTILPAEWMLAAERSAGNFAPAKSKNHPTIISGDAKDGVARSGCALNPGKGSLDPAYTLPVRIENAKLARPRWQGQGIRVRADPSRQSGQLRDHSAHLQ